MSAYPQKSKAVLALGWSPSAEDKLTNGPGAPSLRVLGEEQRPVSGARGRHVGDRVLDATAVRRGDY